MFYDLLTHSSMYFSIYSSISASEAFYLKAEKIMLFLFRTGVTISSLSGSSKTSSLAAYSSIFPSANRSMVMRLMMLLRVYSPFSYELSIDIKSLTSIVILYFFFSYFSICWSMGCLSSFSIIILFLLLLISSGMCLMLFTTLSYCSRVRVSRPLFN